MLDKTQVLNATFRWWPKTGWRNSKARLTEADDAALKDLFHPDSYWRDAVALSWTLQTINGRDAILEDLEGAGREREALGLRHRARTAPRREK